MQGPFLSSRCPPPPCLANSSKVYSDQEPSPQEERWEAQSPASSLVRRAMDTGATFSGKEHPLCLSRNVLKQPQEKAQNGQGLHSFHAQQGHPDPGLHPQSLQCCPGVTLGPLQTRSAFGGAICTLFRGRKEKGPSSPGSVLWGQLCCMMIIRKLAGATLVLPCSPGEVGVGRRLEGSVLGLCSDPDLGRGGKMGSPDFLCLKHASQGQVGCLSRERAGEAGDPPCSQRRG